MTHGALYLGEHGCGSTNQWKTVLKTTLAVLRRLSQTGGGGSYAGGCSKFAKDGEGNCHVQNNESRPKAEEATQTLRRSLDGVLKDKV